MILRNALDGCDDPFVLRAAELFFRTQRMTLHEGSLIAADEETIAGTARTPVSPLVSMLGIPAEAEIDVMIDDNAEHYFEHSDLFHMALDLTGGPARACGAGRGDAALDRASARRRGRRSSRSPNCATRSSPGMSGSMPKAAGSAMRCGTARSSTRRPPARVVGLFRLTFRDPDVVIDKVRGEPVYLILAMTPTSCCASSRRIS